VKKVLNQPRQLFPVQLNPLPLVTRRCAAWALELSLVAVSVLVPYNIGLYAKNHSAAPVPLNPLLAASSEAIAKTLALPRRQQSTPQVPPLTNLFWCGALIAPVVAASWQLYNLRKSGQTLPKRWFGVRVVTASGAPPGWGSIFIREGISRWGLPIGTAYMIWRYTGAFPDLGILLGLAGFMLLGESAALLFDPRRRTLHDRLSGTFALDADSTHVTAESSFVTSSLGRGQPIRLKVVETQSNSSVPEAHEETGLNHKRHKKSSTIVMISQPSWGQLRLRGWMRQNPGLTLLIVAFACLVSVLGTFVGTQVYIQSQTNRRELKQQKNQEFLALVKQLSSTSGNVLEERRAAVMALATIDDKRSISFLADLLSQEKTVGLIDTIQQALVSSGPDALPYLQRLNQSLKNDLEAVQRRGMPSERRLIALRQRATQRAIAKIISIYSNQVHSADLSRIDLSSATTGVAPFTLVLDKIDLSGINFRSTVLTNASLRGSRFYGTGDDRRFGTFDDWIADLSGADLKEANLSGALLSHVLMNRTNLIRATLSQSNLSYAILTGANLSSAQLQNADLRQAVLENAIFTGANLVEANLTQANLQGARLGQVNAIGAYLQFGRLTQSDWQGADLSAANLGQANLQYANLSSTKLAGANLSNAQLQNANLRNADLSKADLRGANLAGADFQGASFAVSKTVKSDEFIEQSPAMTEPAIVKGVNFAQAKNLDRQQIAYICRQGGDHPQCP
jgi:uncharacterized protein YjbI with pentapeptide repeats/uncharacterized RDD family membrane protein YckC